jgi:hypothetical protein
MAAKIEMMWELRKMMREVLALRTAGTANPKLARAQGCVDGYMRGMLESGVATQEELLRLVAEERQNANGPSTGPLVLAVNY